MLTTDHLNQFFNPRSVAIVGASARTGPGSYNLMENLINEDCTVKLYPISVRTDQILGQPAYKSVLDLPEVVDLAIITLPRTAVMDVVRECVEKGIRSIVVITQGFADADEEGNRLQIEIASIIEGTGTRLLGPNSIGLANAFDNFHTSFQKFDLILKPNAMICQSGMFVLGSGDFTAGLGLGIDIGNAADLTFTDLLPCLAADTRIKVINIHMEGLKHGQEFLDVASKITREKPVLVYKVGRSEQGARAAASHSGSLAGEDHVFDAAFDKAGIMRVANLEELNDLNKALLTYPTMNGKRIAVIALSGGGGIATVDALTEHGLEMAKPSPSVMEAIRAMNPPWLDVGNPVDSWMACLKLGLAQAQVEILRLLLDDPQVDGVVILLNCYKATGYESLKDLVEGIVDEAAKTRDKPVALWAFGLNQQEIIENAEALNVVAGFTSPERAARALAGLHRYHNEIKDRASESTPVFEDVKTRTVTDIIRQTRGNGVNLLGSEPLDILAAYGINAATVRLARSKDEAMRLADEMGYPVVLKIACPQVVHKSDVGGVRLNLQDAAQLRAAYDEMVSTIKARVPQTKIDGLVVQKYCGNGIEVIIGAKRSSSFGPLIVFGLGGIYTEVLKDVAFGLAPLTETKARSMISAVKSSAVLAGARGREAADLDALVECILRVSQLVVDFPQIQELDINPLIVGPEGLEAVDARAVLEA